MSAMDCIGKLSVFALSVSAAFVSASAHAYTSASYVQDGLIAQWDGIDNTGVGVHDPGAKAWKDLVGNYDLSLLPKVRVVGGTSLEFKAPKGLFTSIR